jgi:hypothetical protein
MSSNDSYHVAQMFAQANRNNCTEITIEKKSDRTIISFSIDQTTLISNGLFVLNPNHPQYKPYTVIELIIADSNIVNPSFPYFAGYFQNVIDTAINESLQKSDSPITNVKFSLDNFNKFTEQFSTIKFIKGKIWIF